jgi:hypothetical protein
MDLNGDPGRSIKDSVGSLAPSHLWVLGLAVDDDGSLVGPGKRQYSYWAECECPGDCLKDHENE